MFRFDMKCEQCEAHIQMSVNILGLQEGVLGSTGLVPLEDTLLFCNEDCLIKYLRDITSNMVKINRRIP